VKKERRPPHIKNLFATIRECIAKGKYMPSMHATVRCKERGITLSEILYVLKNGYHEQEKSSFDEAEFAWKYAIRHKIEFNDIRIIIAFKDGVLHIITVMHVTK